MSRKLYYAEVMIPLYFIEDDEVSDSQLKDTAISYATDEISNPTTSVEIKLADCIHTDIGWDGNCIPYHDISSKDMKLSDALQLNKFKS